MEHEEAPNEYLAGWIDGSRRGMAQTHNRLLCELEPYGLAIDTQGTVFTRQGDVSSLEVAWEPNGNLLHNEEYEEGYEAGIDEGRHRYLHLARIALLEHDLFATESGSVATVELAADLVSWFRQEHGAAAPSPNTEDAPSTSAPIRDEDLHAFLDAAAPSNEPTALATVAERDGFDFPVTAQPHAGQNQTPEASATGEPTPKPQPQDRDAMIVTSPLRRTTRRAVLATVGGLLTAVTCFGLTRFPADDAAPVETRAASATPGDWRANTPPHIVNQLAPIDDWVNAQYAAGHQNVVFNAVQQIFANPGNRNAKDTALHYIATAGRLELLPAAMPMVSRQDASEGRLRGVFYYSAMQAHAVSNTPWSPLMEQYFRTLQDHALETDAKAADCLRKCINMIALG